MKDDTELKKSPLYQEAILYVWAFKKELWTSYKDNLYKQSAVAQHRLSEQ